METRKKTLKQSIFIGCVLFTSILCVTLCLVNYTLRRATLFSRYEAYIENILRYTASGIDKDDLAACIRSGEESEKYRQLQGFLDQIKDNTDLHFLYVIVPLNTEPTDNILNVIAAVSREEYETQADELVYLNMPSGEAYSPETAKKYLDAYNSGRLSFFEERSQWGDDYTGLLPLCDSAGNRFAALCMDVDVQEIHSVLLSHTILMVLITLAIGVLFTALFLAWTQRNVIRPIEQLEKGLAEYSAAGVKTTDPDALVLDLPAIRTGNELESLTRAVAQMSRDLSESVRSMLSTQQALDRANIIAHKDGLTRVGNKMAYNEYKQSLAERAETEGIPYAVVLADVNHLKLVNDSFGHEKGDLYLKNCCSVICDVFRHSPVFRVGGDEFVAVLVGRDYENRAALLAAARSAMSGEETPREDRLWERCSAALGMAEHHPGQAESVEAVFNRADRDMYGEKERMNAVR